MASKPLNRSRPKHLRTEAEAPLRSQRRNARDPAQPQLPLDLMPERIEPCLALLTAKPPKGPDWAYEVKWDGYRVHVHSELGGNIRILTRGGHDWTHRFPAIEKAALELGPATMILDGEVVVLDEQGRSDFNALVASLGGRGGKKVATDTVLYAFDLLYLDGHDLSKLSLEERRMLLDPLLEKAAGAIRLSEMLVTDGAALFATACELGLEGIVAKRLDAPYRSGRGGEWRKIKCVQSDTFVVVGYEPSTSSPGAIASLLLGARKGDALVYVGSVGTGFTDRDARELMDRLNAMRTKRPAVAVKGKSLVFVEPILAAEIEYRAWTGDGKLRHASYKGLRDAEDTTDVYIFEG
ncbi:ATP-dependent DNA ligase [Rhizobium sp. Leaf371]|uniref:non-homologous end-joining DNA ligase n=1 Tax=unclassified Rhizobium TaxID=2613769 RepID=UPI0007148062|nr:non-homologous end-joining DNA ligase [Rhizobium sp. Leaf371]KQS64606.1 ATP-dependent DNA ligase [Rhizobium sp. Leaf371]